MVLARCALLASVCAASTIMTTFAFFIPSRPQVTNARIAIGRDEGGGRRRSRRRRRRARRPSRDDMPGDDGVDSNLPPSSALASSFSSSSSSSTTTSSSAKNLSSEVDFNSLTVMDVVLFRRRRSHGDDDAVDDPTTATTKMTERRRRTAALEIGAVQENGNVAPLSTWTLESAYTSRANDMMAFVVDERDQFPGLSSDDITVLDAPSSWDGGSAVGYGSRQVGGGKGPGNPHGEESELLYYVDRGVVEGEYRIVTTTTLTMKGQDGDDGGVNDDDDDDFLEVLSIDIVVNPDLEHLW